MSKNNEIFKKFSLLGIVLLLCLLCALSACGGGDGENKYTVELSVSHAVVAFEGFDEIPTEVEASSVLVFTVQPESDYSLEGVYIDGELIYPQDGKYTVSVNGDVEIRVVTEEIPVTPQYTVSVEDTQVNVTFEGYDQLPSMIVESTVLTFTVQPNNGYTLLGVFINGQKIESENGLFSFTLTENVNITFSTQYVEPYLLVTEVDVMLYDDKPCYVIYGNYANYTESELREVYFDFQNYATYNSEFGWTSTEMNFYKIVMDGTTFTLYVDLASLPVETCNIPHFNGTQSEGDIKLWQNNGHYVQIGNVRYTLDSTANEWQCATVVVTATVNNYQGDSTAPAINPITLYEYFMTAELPRIDITTSGGMAIDDSSLIIGYKGFSDDVPEYDYLSATISVSSCEGYELADISASVKVRGNYTSTYPKKPIRIKFDKKQSMCGLNGGEKFKNWVLLNEYKDGSMTRNAVANYLGNTILESDGYYCSDFRYVEVYINGVYNGLYLLVEQQEVKDCRVELPQPIDPEEEPDNPNLNDVKVGYLIEYDGYYFNEKELERFEVTYNRLMAENGSYYIPTQTGFTIKSDVYYAAQRDFVKKCVQTIWDVIYDAIYNDHFDTDKNPYFTMDADGNKVEDKTIQSVREAIERVVDVRSLVDMYILQEICEDMDLAWSSFYMALDMSPEGNRLLTFTAPWDFDSALGNSVTVNNTIYAASSTSGNPWLVICSGQEWFWNHVYAKWTALEEAGAFDGVIEMIDYFKITYESAYAKNYQKWPQCIGSRIESQQAAIIDTLETQAQAANYLKSWLTEKITNFNALIKAKVDSYK